MSGFEFLYVAMFVLGFAGSTLLVLWTRRRARQNEQVDQVPQDDVELPTEFERERVAKGSRPTPTDLPAVTSEPEPGQPPIAQLLFTSRSGTGDRECPMCKRRFTETTVLCPFDSSPLRPVSARSRRTTRPAITGAKRPTCADCGRRYESSAKFCYNDGATLSDATAAEVPILRVCRSCGFETMDVVAQCDCASADVIEIDPSQSGITMPTIPLMHCRTCDNVTSGDQTHCPNDGALLFPVMNVSMNALPPTGIGPRRKICQECGRRFSSAARYCAYDGSSLKHLN